MMSLFIFPLLASLTIVTPPSPQSIKIGLGETIDTQRFSANPGLQAFLNAIDTNVLGAYVYVINDEQGEKTWTLQVTNEMTLTEPLIGTDVILVGYQLANDEGWIELFNPTMTTMNMADYAITINDNVFRFDDGLTLAPFANLVIPFRQGYPAMNSSIGPDHPLFYWTTITRLWLIDNLPSPTLLEAVNVASTIHTAYGEVAFETSWFQKDAKAYQPDFDYQPLHWLAKPLTTAYTPFALAQPTITPLLQAKAWAMYVMYGAGMFAAGRVEEAFRALEREHQWLSLQAQGLLFSSPNTVITGINEQGQNDRSTFREAIGRYNYLAARVPGATGLISPPSEDFPWLNLGYGVIAIVGFAGILILLKAKAKRY